MRGGQELSKHDEQESEPASTMVNQDDEIEPLSGKPFFHLILQKSHVSTPYQLVVPARFAPILPQERVPAILTCGTRKWEMKYFGDHRTHKRLELPHWRTFVEDNKLKVGDACVFELMENGRTVKFKVQILRGDFPSVLLERIDGVKDNPILID